MPVIGFLHTRTADDSAHLLAAFLSGLGEDGGVDGRIVTIATAWGLGQYDRLPKLAAAFVRRRVALLVATGGEPAALAAKAATATIPIIFAIGGDPIGQGLAASFSHPGGNMTGITLLTAQLEPKRLGLLRPQSPDPATRSFRPNSSSPPSQSQLKDGQAAARGLNCQIRVLPANTDAEIDVAFETIRRERIAPLLVGASPFFDTRRSKLIDL